MKRSVKFFLGNKRGGSKSNGALGSNLKGTLAFFIGFFLVIYGWPLVGMIAEGYGFIALFADFIPTAILFMKRIPVIGPILDMASVKNVRFTGKKASQFNST